jgi:6-phosphogluconolactonase/glucosamine-6-phosphate isomerase/deaminase
VQRDDSTDDPNLSATAHRDSPIRVEIFEDHLWADEVARRLATHLSDHPATRICLPTGETPRPLYMAAAPLIDVSAATVFLLDEFGLPPGSFARCDSMLQRHLLESLDKPPGVYHRLDVNAPDPTNECDRFDSLVADGGLDLTLLGLGGNGHLALNEPGTAADSPTRVTELAPSTADAVRGYDVAADPVDGMTLGLRRILASEEIWLLVTGSHKALILERTINGPIGPDLPASFLRDHPKVVVYADRSAAALL